MSIKLFVARLRLRLLSLMMLVLLICIWFSYIIHNAHLQRDAVMSIKGVGGSVMYDWQPESPRNPFDPLEGPEVDRSWRLERLVEWVGIDVVANVIQVNLGSGASDAVLWKIPRLRRLQVLNLSGSSITDSGLAALKGMTRLRVLEMNDTKVSDAAASISE